MANLQYTAFPDAGVVALGDPAAEAVVAIGAGSLQSAALPGSRISYRVRVYPEADCYVTWGANPTAKADGTDGRMMGANNPEYFAIEGGHKIAVIQRP